MGIALTEYTLGHFPSSSVVYGAKIDIGATLFSPTRKKFNTLTVMREKVHVPLKNYLHYGQLDKSTQLATPISFGN